MKKVISVLLILAMTLSMFASCGGESEVKLKDFENFSSYTVVRSAETNVMLYQSAAALVDAIAAQSGVKLPMATDKNDAIANEILVGVKNRDEAKEDLKYADFVVKFENNKLCLLGGSPSAVKNAVDWYIENCLKDGVKIPAKEYRNDVNYDLKDAKIDGILLSEFLVQKPSNAMWQDPMEELQDAISSRTGVRLTESSHKIILQKDEKMTDFDAYVKSEGGNIILTLGFGCDDANAAKKLLLEVLTSGDITLDKGGMGDVYRESHFEKEETVMMRVDNRQNPIGIDYKNPEFSWIVNATERGQKQTAYELGISSTKEKAEKGDFDVYSSGKVESSDTTVKCGVDLKAKTQYFWAVKVYDKDGKELPSMGVGTFETGLFGDFGTSNKWIEAQGDSASLASSLFRKEFTLTKSLSEVSKARLYSTAAGSQIMYVNGERASNDYMAPGKSQYTTTLFYQTYDVTSLILEGANTVAADVGHGWYNAGASGANYGTNTALKAKLIITYKDGSEQVIDTDASWLGTKDGPTTTNKYYIGQHIDGRKAIDKWAENGCTSTKFSAVTATDSFTTTAGYTMSSNFVGENMEPVRCVKVVNPTKVENPATGVYVYYFDQNIVGTSRITANASAGTEMTVTYSEWVESNGRIKTSCYANSNGPNNNGVDKYIFRGDASETVEFDQVYHGFQYIEITGLDKALPLDAVEGLILTSDIERTGYLETSNTKINKYLDNVMWSIRGNFVSTLTDCPTREKNTWTGDAQIFAATASYFANVYNHYRNFEDMTRASARPDGAIPQLVPTEVTPTASTVLGKTPSGWSDSVIVIPWEMYNQYGDTDIIADNYDVMKGWISFLLESKVKNTSNPSDVSTYYVRQGGSYGDHLAYYNYKEGIGYQEADEQFPNGEKTWYETSFNEVGTAFTAYSCDILSQMAEVIGETDDAKYYADLYQKFAKAWRDNFLEADGITSKANSQTSYAMGLYFKLYEADKMSAAAEKLAEVVEKENYIQTVGFIGMNFLYPALADNGQFDTAMKIMENQAKPSLLYMVNRGATTIWENYEGGISANHYVFSAPSRWLYTDVLGIAHEYDSNNIGFNHFVLKPTYTSYDSSVTWVKGSYASIHGEIKAEWKLNGNVFEYTCTIPANTTATLELPVSSTSAAVTESGVDAATAEGVSFVKNENGRNVYELQSGTYTFVVNN